MQGLATRRCMGGGRRVSVDESPAAAAPDVLEVILVVKEGVAALEAVKPPGTTVLRAGRNTARGIPFQTIGMILIIALGKGSELLNYGLWEM